jgi:hypothetical protein
MGQSATFMTCEAAVESIRFMLDGELDSGAESALNQHLAGCGGCKAEFEKRRKVLALLGNTFNRRKISDDFDVNANKRLTAMRETPARAHTRTAPSARKSARFAAPQDPDQEVEEQEEEEVVAASGPGMFANLGGAPWWLVSCALHVLVILLASLVSMAIELPKSDDAVIMLTELSQRPTVDEQKQEEQKKPAENALDSRKDTDPTDPTSKDVSDIQVPPDILAKAEIGDHWETINPDRPDTHSAFGNPDAHSFHSVKGDDSPEGGGGTGGMGMEDVIGVGGAASKGSGGGFGGGDGTGIGTGKGSGTGSFGQRGGGGRKLMVKRHGGSKATENAVDKALQWLAYHQEADGHWDTVKYGATKGKVDTAMTSLALLAFLGAGHTEKVGTYKDNVVRGVGWLKGHQEANGLVFDRTDAAGINFGYSAAMATMALSEAAGMANIKDTRESAQKSVNYCVDVHQNGEGSEKRGWRYAAKSNPEDISNSGWFVMALKSAKVAGVHVDPAAFEGAIKYIDALEVKNAGPDAGYGPPSRFLYCLPNTTVSKHRDSAIGVLCRQFLGWKKEDLQASVELYIQDGGTPSDAKSDLYYWYYGALSTFQQGGDIWKRWNEDMKGALLPTQCKAGDDEGSWTPKGEFCDHWGRVGQTALSALCLEVYYRYMQMQPGK